MAKHGKNFAGAREKLDREARYTFLEGLEKALEAKYAKFDETVDVAVRLGRGPSPRRPDGAWHGGAAQRHR